VLVSLTVRLSYVQRLEERVAQLEQLIPQESLDHIDGVQQNSQVMPDSRSEIQVRISSCSRAIGLSQRGCIVLDNIAGSHIGLSSHLSIPFKVTALQVNLTLHCAPKQQALLQQSHGNLSRQRMSLPTYSARCRGSIAHRCR
jgi:hypothetical protein